MAKDDYHVLAYKALAYLYACLKAGTQPDLAYLMYDTKQFPIHEQYWCYLYEMLYREGYVEGVTLVPVIGRQLPGVRLDETLRILPKGIEYLQENAAMRRARDFLKEIKEIVPGF